MTDFIPYGHQSINDDDIEAVIKVLRGDWLTTGPAVESFERKFADYVGSRYAVAFSSGTAALHGAMHAAGIKENDRVVVPPLTFAATSNSVIYCGGVPLFADIDENTACLDIQKAADLCASRKDVRALAPVSFAGYPADIAALRACAKERGIVVIEDASHALGAFRDVGKVGTEADLTTFSFHPVKHITTAEGGMVTTDNGEYATKMRRFRTHGIVKSESEFVRPYAGPWDNDMLDIGFNYRLSDLASALGESQLARVDEFVKKRVLLADYYRSKLADRRGVKLPPKHDGHSYHLFSIWVDPDMRKRVFNGLRGADIGVQVHYPCVHLHTYYRKRFGYSEGGYPVAERYSAGQISLPIYPDMTFEQVDYVVDNLVSLL